ncbi:hypothetical protein PoB_005282300 [Plakobranchus ocellatus]|uniref:Uncharacterized protein n=1 Tax=Plakobranchus ocellatus TaxID=259542 RepID=A0AAV4C336_9GAST|nr:hypothetical protein PoB_005282300 [Plakobranchus ocellatus]
MTVQAQTDARDYIRLQKKNCTASPQQCDLMLLGPPSGHGAGNGARSRDRRIPADLRADSLATMPPTTPYGISFCKY